MGKKSRRPNRNKPQLIPAAASSAVASPQEETDDVAAVDPNQFATFHQLFASQDWEGALELESEMSAIANISKKEDPGPAGIMNVMLGSAHRFLGREGAYSKHPGTTKKLSKWQ